MTVNSKGKKESTKRREAKEWGSPEKDRRAYSFQTGPTDKKRCGPGVAGCRDL